MSNLVEGGHGFFNIFKGGHLQKKFGKPCSTVIYNILLTTFLRIVHCNDNKFTILTKGRNMYYLGVL